MIMTSGYPEMTEIIRRVADELKFDVTVVEGILDEAAQEVKRLVEKGGYEVVISRAGTAKAISQIVDLPIVYSDSDHFDLIQAFIRAKKYGDKICFVTYPETGFPFNFEQIFEAIGFEVTILPYKNQEELMNQIKNAKKMGMEVVVGGGIRTAEVVRNHGMKSMYLTTDERTIKRALILASKVAQDRIFIREKAERLNAVINVSEEGILFLNRLGKVETCNPAAERIFDVKEQEIIGKTYQQITNPKLLELLKQDIIYSGKGSFTLHNLIVTYEPVIVSQERVGTVITCREFSRIQKLENKVRRELHAKGLVARFTFSDICHQSEKMREVIQLAKEYALTDSTVLIIGESGTGKELIAQSIHNASKRKDGPFVAVNCAALPESLLESELFGYAEGAFTGANKGGRQGVFELAHGGTIFLDEIGEIPHYIQTRLLRVLQEKEVMRVGGDRVTPVDIRIVAATNRKLWELVKEGKFRSDLYFRLSVLHLQVPPLQQRRDDIPVLVNHFLKTLGSPLTFEQFSRELQHFFMNYSWPGNIRQLENIIQRFHLRAGNLKEDQDFIKDVLMETEDAQHFSNHDEALVISYGTMEEIERQVISQMLERYENNRTIVAEKLGISRTTLWKKLNES
jgi:PAS domain S-box-containing protein